MASNTYTLISSSTLSSNSATVTFSSIPQTYNNLVLRISGRNTSNNFGSLFVWVNGSPMAAFTSGSNGYYARNLRYNGTTSVTTNTNLDNVSAVQSDFTASVFSNAEIYFPNYTNSLAKSFIIDGASENFAATAYIISAIGLQTATSPITSITVGNYTTPDLWATGSTFYLYGVKNS